ncbi:protein disulfide-isomerase A6-like [Protopterus annectens]|uniref:protein disulfide-isomerase A6-like n=1 Tax=Protopterus annectens TaxID=7888 RepID=UPI001CFB4E16|nr:protein disulfide-isomerase A6-like [Protopterus annectens]
MNLLLALGTLAWILLSAIRAQPMYDAFDDVVVLNPSNFDQKVLQSRSIWLVEFYAPWCKFCRNLAPEWKRVAAALKGIIKVGAVNSEKHHDLSERFGVKTIPTIKVFGPNKNEPADFNQALPTEAKTAHDIIDHAMSIIGSLAKGKLWNPKAPEPTPVDTGKENTDVIELTDATFNQHVLDSDEIWMVEFYAPWCEHCQKLAPEWAATATDVKERTQGKVKLGAVDATVNVKLARKYDIQGFPVIKTFLKETPVEFKGKKTKSELLTHAVELMEESERPAPVLELLDEDTLITACDNNLMCIFAVLPPPIISKVHERHECINALKILARKFKKKDWGWLWTEEGLQPELQESLGIRAVKNPAVVAVHNKRMIYYKLEDPFHVNSVTNFLREVAAERGTVYNVKNDKYPKMRTVAPWDGTAKVLSIIDPNENDADRDEF